MTTVIYHTLYLPSVSAPFGDSNTPGTADVECERDDQGVLWIGRSDHMGATEGTNPGQWERISGADDAQISTLRSDFQALLSDSDPRVALKAQAIHAAFDGVNVKSTINTLRAVMNNTGASTSDRIGAMDSIFEIVTLERTRQ